MTNYRLRYRPVNPLKYFQKNTRSLGHQINLPAPSVCRNRSSILGPTTALVTKTSVTKQNYTKVTLVARVAIFVVKYFHTSQRIVFRRETGDRAQIGLGAILRREIFFIAKDTRTNDV